MEWSEDSISQLRALWVEGHSTAEIGRRMGITKNAVVGKAHRLKLSARPSPIRRDGANSIARPRPALRATRTQALPPPVPTVGPLVADPASGTALPASRTAPPASRTAPPTSRTALRSIPKSTVTYGRVLPCCWPIGEPGTPSFRFCDGETVPNKPYCHEHARLAYVRVRDRRDTAA